MLWVSASPHTLTCREAVHMQTIIIVWQHDAQHRAGGRNVHEGGNAGGEPGRQLGPVHPRPARPRREGGLPGRSHRIPDGRGHAGAHQCVFSFINSIRSILILFLSILGVAILAMLGRNGEASTARGLGTGCQRYRRVWGCHVPACARRCTQATCCVRPCTV